MNNLVKINEKVRKQVKKEGEENRKHNKKHKKNKKRTPKWMEREVEELRRIAREKGYSDKAVEIAIDALRYS